MILTVVAFLLILGFLVLVHELGHFLVARALGVAVEEFGLGFPPRVLSRRLGATRWSLNAIPLGGFVKIKGEEATSSHEPDSFAARGPGQRTLIVVAGVTMNIVTAWLIFLGIFALGAPMEVTSDINRAYVQQSSIAITEVLPKSPADSAGLKAGDKVLSADSQAFSNIDDLQTFIAQHNNLIGLYSPDQMELRGIFIAQNGYFGRNYYPCPTYAPYCLRSKLEITGSVVSDGRVGTQWGSGISGYLIRESYFDPKLIHNPPVFVPNIEQDFKIVDWKEVK